jgi:DASS family divalent anion:Na+ symporter
MATATVATQPALLLKPSKLIFLLVAIVVGAAIILIPTPQGMTRPAQIVLGITAFTVVLWASNFMNNGVTSVLMMGLLVLTGTPPPRVLSGFSGPPWWILVLVLYYGFAMQKTGLAERLSYYILSLFPGTYAGILAAFFSIGFVLALGIPSMTVRTAIMVPIAWALVQSLGLKPRSRGSALIMLTVVEMAVVPGLAFLYGSLNGPVVAAAFQAKSIPIAWLTYAQANALPTLVLCALILVGNQLVLKPEAPLETSSSFARERLKALGSFKRPELIVAVVVILSIVFWATDRLHHLPSFLAGTFALAVFAISGILRDQDIGGGVSWTLLLFIGGIFGLANVIQDYKVTDWLAGFFVPVANGLIYSPVLLLVVVALAMLLMRFLDPSAFIAIPLLFLPVVDVLSKAGIPPLVLSAPLLLASAQFWLTYENFWVAMGEGMTANQAFSQGQQFRLASVYGVAVLISVVVGVGYWKLVGLL